MKPFRCYRQLEHSDCGLTCIRMVARHFGKKIPLRTLRERTDMSRLGMSLKDIVNCCDSLGMDAQGVKIGVEYAERMPLPAILYWRQQHFVVLHEVDSRRRRYHIADPAQGKMVYREEEFAKYWIPENGDRGLAILIDPREEFATTRYEEVNYFQSFFSYIYSFFKSHRKNFIIAAIVTLLVMAFDMLIPLILRKSVDDGIGSGDIGLVAALLLCQLAITLGTVASTCVSQLLMTRTGISVNLDMVNRFLSRLAKFPLSFFDRKVSSDFIQKINDQGRIKDFLLSFPQTMMMTLLNLVVFSAMLLHFSVPVFVLFIGMSALEIGWNLLFLRPKKSIDYAMFTQSSINHNHAMELTYGMADLKVNNAEEAKISKWRKNLEQLNAVSLRSTRLGLLEGGGHTLISRAKELLVTGLGAVMVINGDISMGVLMTLGYITGRLAQPFNSISSTVASLQEAMLSYMRIDDVLNDDDSPRGNARFSEASMSLRNVWFKYAGSASPYVIKDFSLDVMPGSTIAIVGESGCGKSTLLKLLLGFYIPQLGELMLSGRPVKDLDNRDWLSHCGVVMQEARVFSGSIIENVSLSSESPDENRVVRLLETVGLDDFISSLPMGVHTQLGTAGIELSGGQKQRLIIARALYKDPQILIMDEATSSLDAISERRIVEKIREYGSGRTIIIAAHRLSTIMDADKIVYIKDGRVAESGTHDELLAIDGHYRRLVTNQLQHTNLK